MHSIGANARVQVFDGDVDYQLFEEVLGEAVELKMVADPNSDSNSQF